MQDSLQVQSNIRVGSGQRDGNHWKTLTQGNRPQTEAWPFFGAADEHVVIAGGTHTAIRQLIINLKVRGDALFTAAQNISEFWNASTRPASARGGYGLPLEKVERRVAFIERYCSLLFEDAGSYARWKLLLSQNHIVGVSVHDARIVSLMSRDGLVDLVPLNADDFRRYKTIVAITPQELLKSLGSRVLVAVARASFYW